MLCMGSAGYIYWQPMNDESHASNGPFYVTNTLEVFHNDIKVCISCRNIKMFLLIFFLYILK